jgi:hypothetical protein
MHGLRWAGLVGAELARAVRHDSLCAADRYTDHFNPSAARYTRRFL